MKITKAQLRQIIKEELGRAMGAGTWKETATPIEVDYIDTEEGPYPILPTRPTIKNKVLEIIKSNPGVAIGQGELAKWFHDSHNVGSDADRQDFEDNVDTALNSRRLAKYYDYATDSFKA